ncbi:hypothetical protein [Parasitella parasitica]|uniref:Uncharacterized protein n=1 Tax=Parasitella parasitica TaxID=35722 RepID=A0A0B7MV41_9FUNG|nr:hypothetical protein [Parasitella parasitica]
MLQPSTLSTLRAAVAHLHEHSKDSGRLYFQVVTPKETRGKRRITKPFTVHPHSEDFESCPVQCFKALRDHPALRLRPANSNLFVKSNNVSQPLSSSTVSSWLHLHFIPLCTNESRVSIRSLALDLGISPQANIVALGN